MLSAIPSEAKASVTVNLATNIIRYVNDGDDGLYISDQRSSERKAQAEIYRAPLAADKQPRWALCTGASCAKEPIPSQAPGPSGLKLSRQMLPVERKYYINIHESETISPPIAALRDAMRISAARLEYVSVQGIGDAMMPVREALTAVDDQEHFYAVTARKANKLAFEWAELRKLLIQAEVSTPQSFKSAWSGDYAIPCNAANDLVSGINQAAGLPIVDWRWEQNKTFLSAIFGTRNLCRYKPGTLENPLLAYIRFLLNSDPADGFDTVEIKNFWPLVN